MSTFSAAAAVRPTPNGADVALAAASAASSAAAPVVATLESREVSA